MSGIADVLEVGEAMAPPANLGYGQDDRTSGWNDNGKLGVQGLRMPGDLDCSFASALAYYLGGIIERAVLTGTIYSGNYSSVLGRTGMVDRIDVRKLTLAQIKAKAKPADEIVGPGHVMLHLGGDRWLSFETTEKGKSTGGKLGRQKGEGVRVRGLYMRGASSRAKGGSKTGWVTLIRPKSPAVFVGQMLAAYSNGKSITAAQNRLRRVSSWSAARYGVLMKWWARWDEGMTLAYDATKLAVPATGHTYVVLGSTIAKMNRRLPLAIAGLKANPGSKVVVTGGVVRDGKTEAAYMRDRLVAAGISADRIITETKSMSTVGNALNSLPLLTRFATVTLVSDASHLRRAKIEFLAARVKLEVQLGRVLTCEFGTPLAFNDYGSAPVKPTRPVTAATRKAITTEVAALLGLTTQYKTAL